MEDNTLSTDIAAMNVRLQHFDRRTYFCNMQDNQMKRSIALDTQTVCRNGACVYTICQSISYWLMCSFEDGSSSRLSKGYNSPIAPLAFAYYGETLVSMGNISEGCRLGEFVVRYAPCLLFMWNWYFIFPLIWSYITYSIYYDCVREIGT